MKIFKIDATEFNKKVGDTVKRGEVLGLKGNDKVVCDMDGKIISVYFDADNHILEILVDGD